MKRKMSVLDGLPQYLDEAKQSFADNKSFEGFKWKFHLKDPEARRALADFHRKLELGSNSRKRSRHGFGGKFIPASQRPTVDPVHVFQKQELLKTLVAQLRSLEYTFRFTEVLSFQGRPNTSLTSAIISEYNGRFPRERKVREERERERKARQER